MIKEYQDPSLVKIDEAQLQSEDSSNRQRGKKKKSKDKKGDNNNRNSKQQPEPSDEEESEERKSSSFADGENVVKTRKSKVDIAHSASSDSLSDDVKTLQKDKEYITRQEIIF